MAKLPRDIQKALEDLTETRNRILRLGIPEDARTEGFEFTDDQASALNDAYNVGQCVEYLTVQILQAVPVDERPRAILNL